MIEVNAQTELEGSPETVWSVLTDLEKFAAWNPFIRNARGSTEVGGEVRVRVKPSLPIRLVFKANVLDSEATHELRWIGHVLAPWFARGEHTFKIEQIGKRRVRFTQTERFGGILPRLGKRLLSYEAKRGFEAMNRALADRVRALEAAQRVS